MPGCPCPSPPTAAEGAREFSKTGGKEQSCSQASGLRAPHHRGAAHPQTEAWGWVRASSPSSLPPPRTSARSSAAGVGSAGSLGPRNPAKALGSDGRAWRVGVGGRVGLKGDYGSAHGGRRLLEPQGGAAGGLDRGAGSVLGAGRPRGAWGGCSSPWAPQPSCRAAPGRPRPWGARWDPSVSAPHAAGDAVMRSRRRASGTTFRSWSAHAHARLPPCTELTASSPPACAACPVGDPRPRPACGASGARGVWAPSPRVPGLGHSWWWQQPPHWGLSWAVCVPRGTC